MDERLQYLEALENTTASLGWRLILEDVEKQIEAARLALDGVTDLRGLGVLQGRIGAFQEIATLKEHIMAQLTEIAIEAQEDADV
jgi:predicted  nucleic acid-binding Zn-ribbon protein